MSGADDDSSDKSFDATPQKLKKAREKGEIARSTDLSVAASYLGLLLAISTVGLTSIQSLGAVLMGFLDRPEEIWDLLLDGSSQRDLSRLIFGTMLAFLPWFVVPAASVLLVVLAQRAFVVTPSKLNPKLSRISLLSNAKNKFGRSGLFEFSKSFAKLVLYSTCLAFFLRAHLPEMMVAARSEPAQIVGLMGGLSKDFLFLVVVIALALGTIDALWQHQEHQRKNRMSRKEVMDENKDSEGDPHTKQKRRQMGQEIALSQMMADVPGADVVIVNPTHFAVALTWSRQPGAAPTCVAKGIDEIAGTIRKVASESGVPIHSDPPTARALYATVAIGQEVEEQHYGPVAAAIRFAEEIRQRAKQRIT